MESLAIALVLCLLLATALTRTAIKRRRTERVFFARGYVYVRIRMADSTIHKGFLQRGLLRKINTESNAFQIILESYKTGALSTVNTHHIQSVEVLKPPAMKTGRGMPSRVRGKQTRKGQK